MIVRSLVALLLSVVVFPAIAQAGDDPLEPVRVMLEDTLDAGDVVDAIEIDGVLFGAGITDSPVAAGQLVRLVDDKPIDLADEGFRKAVAGLAECENIYVSLSKHMVGDDVRLLQVGISCMFGEDYWSAEEMVLLYKVSGEELRCVWMGKAQHQSMMDACSTRQDVLVEASGPDAVQVTIKGVAHFSGEGLDEELAKEIEAECKTSSVPAKIVKLN